MSGRIERLARIKIKTINGFFIQQHQQSLARDSLKVYKKCEQRKCLFVVFLLRQKKIVIDRKD